MNEELFHLGIKAVIINSEKEMLLLRCSRSKSFDLPGGRVQKNERPLETLRREVFEETGIEKLLDLMHLHTGITAFRVPIEQGDVGLIFSIYLCHTQSTQIQLSEEHSDSYWLSIETAAELLEPTYPKDFIDKLANLKQVVSK